MKIDVNSLPAGTTEDDLRKLFEAFGKVTSINFFVGIRGELIGLVEMPADTEAMMAVINLNGRDLKGQKIQVREAPESRRRASELRYLPHPRGKFES